VNRVLALLCAVGLCCLASACGSVAPQAAPDPAGEQSSEVVVTLASPPVAGRTGASGRAARAAIDREQARFASELHDAIPGARIRWRYRLVLNGAAVVLPQRTLGRLRALPGVRKVDAGATYTVSRVTAGDVARAARTWSTGLTNQGAGIKIGIIDDGVDQTHPYFAPAGYTMPAGFPKGQAAYTTAKVIVARAFAPAGITWKYARKPFDPVQSGHATHVAGIAAGNAGTAATGGVKVSGIAPRAYIGNYKALSVPTDANVGLDGNAPELVAAIEAAVADGMDVINLSLGEPEIEPSRDIVARALNAAAAAGVVPVVAAGNDFEEYGGGSLISPGTSDKAITVAAVTSPEAAGGSALADFSSAGPTPLSLRLKPDISAPGVSILSSVPGDHWEAMSGTSMATPQIAGAAALQVERHPAWTVADVKAALIETGSPVKDGSRAATPVRAGGGLANPARADVPLVLASPASVSFGILRPGASAPTQLTLADAGGGAGTWDVAVEPTGTATGAAIVVAPTVAVPGGLDLTATVASGATDGDLTGFVRLTRGADIRRIPFWLRVGRPALATEAATPLNGPGLRAGNTRGKPSLVSRYRYPDVPQGGIVTAVLQGPEQVFRFTLRRPVANLGVVITRRNAAVKVEPRIVEDGDENRLTGYAALPTNLNPYLEQFGNPVLAAAAIRPLAGSYDIVFDSANAAGAGGFAFRFWVDDTQPPSLRLTSARVRRNLPLLVHATDLGSGIDATTIKATIDGRTCSTTLVAGSLRIRTTGVKPGKHQLRLQASDYQESRNMENVPPILPTTRVLQATIVIR
jgi:subtilisin family serine protease